MGRPYLKEADGLYIKRAGLAALSEKWPEALISMGLISQSKMMAKVNESGGVARRG